MPKHYDVHLIHIIHVVVENDGMDKMEWVAIDQAAEAVRSNLAMANLSPREFWVSDKQDVYPVDPCDCQKEIDQ